MYETLNTRVLIRLNFFILGCVIKDSVSSFPIVVIKSFVYKKFFIFSLNKLPHPQRSLLEEGGSLGSKGLSEMSFVNTMREREPNL